MAPNTPNNGPENTNEEKQINAYHIRNSVSAVMLMALMSAIAVKMEWCGSYSKSVSGSDLDALKEELTLEIVKQRLPKATDAQAENIYKRAKVYYDAAKERAEKEDLIEIMPGAYISKDKLETLAKSSPVAQRVKDGERQPAYILGGEIIIQSDGEPAIMAKPAADQVTKAAQAMAKDGKELKIARCYRTLARAAILSAVSYGGKFGRTADPGESAHGAGLACDITNAAEAQDYLAEVGMLGGCYASMPGSDFWHFSFGEMQKNSAITIAACKRSPKWVKKGGEAIGRTGRKIVRTVQKWRKR